MSPTIISENGSIIVRATVHSFTLGDVEDPDLYCAGPLYAWQMTDAGKFCLDKQIPQTLVYSIEPDMNTYGYRVYVRCSFNPQDYTFFKLKYL